MSEPTRMVPQEAKKAHSDLVQALGTEHQDGQWMVFMAAVERWIPVEVFQGAGRPSKEQIERSPIGQLGFGSWKALLTTPQAESGLGLPWGRWKEWRRAWAIVHEHPWLQEQDVTASAVRQLAQRVAQAGEAFPADSDEWARFEAARRTQRDQERAESMAALKSRVEELETEVSDWREQYGQLEAVAEERRRLLERAQRGTLRRLWDAVTGRRRD